MVSETAPIDWICSKFNEHYHIKNVLNVASFFIAIWFFEHRYDNVKNICDDEDINPTKQNIIFQNNENLMNPISLGKLPATLLFIDIIISNILYDFGVNWAKEKFLALRTL